MHLKLMIDTKADAARGLLAGYGEAAWLLSDSVNNPAGPAIYICDVSSGRVLLLLTAPGVLQKLSDQADLDEPDYLDVRTALTILIDDVLRSQDGIHPDTRRGLILGAALCVSETRGFHMTKHQGADVQYLLVRYPDPISGDHVLTPMPVFKSHPIAAADLEASVMHVLASEQLSHPDRFVGHSSVQFRQSRRSVVSGDPGRAPRA